MARTSNYHNDRLRPIESSLPTARGASRGERDRAAALVARYARSPDDRKELLNALGLDPERRPDAGWTRDQRVTNSGQKQPETPG
ncbi:hypothetical protein [Streptomyces pacificus]|uniref:Uncharacterized protein n=1 Tax=Streptomyces pacificus TaxID=2705029 RepID=A0A6A0AVP8_9ACTN|nr:hypothetical protein [Streptomyces pacificus]GFH36024.1 hypothetical protein SCWH03_22460 [Streptomyces pacificus]